MARKQIADLAALKAVRLETGRTVEEELASLQAMARLMDSKFEAMGMRFGVDAFVGLVPVLGDLATLAAGSTALFTSLRLKLPWHVHARIVANLASAIRAIDGRSRAAFRNGGGVRRERPRHDAAQLAALERKAKAAGITVTQRHAENDHPWRAIVDTAKDIGASLIVMSSHGRRGISALVIGSETQKVLTHTDVPVLVVR